MDDKIKNQNQINIDLPENVADGIYSNLAVITHSNAEFVIDFLAVLPGLPKAKVKSRIILTPAHAKRLLRALRENITKFEQAHGEVKDNEINEGFPPIMGPTGMA